MARKKHGIGFIAVNVDPLEARGLFARLRHQGVNIPTDEELDAALARAGLRRGDGLKIQRKLAEKDLG